MPCLPEQLTRVKLRFRRNAADIDARTAQCCPFDHHDPRATLAGGDRSGEGASARADDGDIEPLWYSPPYGRFLWALLRHAVDRTCSIRRYRQGVDEAPRVDGGRRREVRLAVAEVGGRFDSARFSQGIGDVPFAVDASHSIHGHAVLDQIARGDDVNWLDRARRVARHLDRGDERSAFGWTIEHEQRLTSPKVGCNVAGSGFA